MQSKLVKMKTSNKVNVMSPIFRDIVAAYCFSKKYSYEESIIIHKIVDMYKSVFQMGADGLCTHYLDAFFEELAIRGNENHIREIASMFGYKNEEQKWGNRIFRRFLVTLRENYNKNK